MHLDSAATLVTEMTDKPVSERTDSLEQVASLLDAVLADDAS
jgi:hypothetical protein